MSRSFAVLLRGLVVLAIPLLAVAVQRGDYDRLFTRRLLASSAAYGKFSTSTATATDGPLTVGIIGAGAAGLYSAILLESLGVSCEVLEADTQAGGRIRTHYFDEAAWKRSRPGEPAYYDYVDVGAMRVPRMPYMDRLIGSQNHSLFNYINARTTGLDQITTIPFLFNSNNTFLLYNDKLRAYQDTLTGDPFGVGALDGGSLPETFASENPGDVWNGIIDQFTNALNDSLEDGYEKLMAFDAMSVRGYLRSVGYTDAEVDWLETTEDASGHYDAGLSETVLEKWIFDAAPESMWLTVEGGFSRIINGLLRTLTSPVRLSQRVIKMSVGADGRMEVSTNATTRYYDHVISTTALGALRAMDLTGLPLDYEKKVALRKLNYDPATKVGIKFKTRWWEELPLPIKGGQSYSDLPIRHCVFPSYGVNTRHAAASMIASYTWGQDAARIGSYMATAEARADLIDLTLRNLAAMNNVTDDFLRSQYVDSFALSWYDNEFTLGAFAFFDPAEFTTLMPTLLQPAADGRMHFAGEALSTGHAWVVGALNSAYRAVAEVLAREQRTDLLIRLVDLWGEVDEIDMNWYHKGGVRSKVATE
ncbi:MAG: hypothetical protein M1838_002425 [Thelocarpon superellum]|nr:MAG: hypothetical protein M1838_002425 [Thelocarpon superellum]